MHALITFQKSTAWNKAEKDWNEDGCEVTWTKHKGELKNTISKTSKFIRIRGGGEQSKDIGLCNSSTEITTTTKTPPPWKLASFYGMLKLGATGEPGAQPGASQHKEQGNSELLLGRNTSPCSCYPLDKVVITCWDDIHGNTPSTHAVHTEIVHAFEKVNTVHTTRTPGNEDHINIASFKLLLLYTLKI